MRPSSMPWVCVAGSPLAIYGAPMARFRKTITTVLVALIAVTAFGYGACVGYYRWPPFGMLRAIAQTVNERAPGPGNSPYYEARAALFRELNGMPDIVMLGDSLTEWGNWHELVPEFRVINRGIAGDTSSGVLDRLEEVIARRPVAGSACGGLRERAGSLA